MALPWNWTYHSNQNHPPSATGVDKYFIWLDEDDDGLVTKAELKSVLQTILDDYEKGREGSYESDCLDLSCLVLSCCARARRCQLWRGENFDETGQIWQCVIGLKS